MRISDWSSDVCSSDLEADDGVIATTLWASGGDFGFNQDGIREIRALGLTFATPKPERLISRILHIATNAGDLVLASFLGSGTTNSEERRLGNTLVSTRRTRWSPYHSKKKNKIT